MQLGAGLNTGCLSLLILGSIAMLSACWVRSFFFSLFIFIIFILSLIGTEFYSCTVNLLLHLVILLFFFFFLSILKLNWFEFFWQYLICIVLGLVGFFFFFWLYFKGVIA